jgi:hypothetical protein
LQPFQALFVVVAGNLDIGADASADFALAKQVALIDTPIGCRFNGEFVPVGVLVHDDSHTSFLSAHQSLEAPENAQVLRVMANPDLLFVNGHFGCNIPSQLEDRVFQQSARDAGLADKENPNHEGPLLPQPLSPKDPVRLVDREAVQDKATEAIRRPVPEELVQFGEKLDAFGQVNLHTVNLLDVVRGRLLKRQFARGHIAPHACC